MLNYNKWIDTVRDHGEFNNSSVYDFYGKLYIYRLPLTGTLKCLALTYDSSNFEWIIDQSARTSGIDLENDDYISIPIPIVVLESGSGGYNNIPTAIRFLNMITNEIPDILDYKVILNTIVTMDGEGFPVWRIGQC